MTRAAIVAPVCTAVGRFGGQGVAAFTRCG